jgi:hypothetical protein
MLGPIGLHVDTVLVLIVRDLPELQPAGWRIPIAPGRSTGLPAETVVVLPGPEPLAGPGGIDGAEEHSIAQVRGAAAAVADRPAPLIQPAAKPRHVAVIAAHVREERNNGADGQRRRDRWTCRIR